MHWLIAKLRNHVGVVAGLVLLAVMRLTWIDAYPLNSDEAQHAHVAWSWTQDLRIYRDTFDNHGPLFGWLHAWVVRLVGERPDILHWLRLSTQVWYALALWATWRIGRHLFGAGVALAAVMLAGLELRFFLVSGQFRTDDLWAAAWLWALAAVVGVRSRARSWLLFGLCTGAALAVSQKTVVLLAMAAISAVIVALARRPWAGTFTARHAWAAVLGFVLVPGAFAIWLGAHNLLGPAWYALVSYNVGGVAKTEAVPKFVLALVLYAALAWVTVRRLRLHPAQDLCWAAFLLLQSGGYLLLVWFVWPLVTPQDFLPAIPPLVLLLCAACAGSPWLRERSRLAKLVAVLAVLTEATILLVLHPPWKDELAPQREELRTVLRYTDAGNTVMDPKGDAIFRRRAYFPIIESLAMARMREGLMPDTIAADMVRHGSMLVIHRRMPPGSDAFVWDNFLPVQGDIWIAGQCVPGRGLEHDLQIAMPGNYTLAGGEGAMMASMDGQPMADHWNLNVGRHHLNVATSQPMALVWSQAWNRGWRPVASARADGDARDLAACH